MDFQNIVNIHNTLKEIAFSSVFPKMENNDYVSRYLDFFKASGRFSLVEFENFVRILSEGLYKEIKGVSTPLEAKQPIEKLVNKCFKCGAVLAPLAKFCQKCGQISNTETKNSVAYVPSVPAITEASKQKASNFTTPPSLPPEKPLTSSLREDKSFGTTVLGTDESFGTTVLSPDELNVHVYAFLIRTKGNEKIVLNKPVFRIGKEKSYVDYFISDNNAVSRSHADLISKNGEYYILDHDSTNKTYLNNNPIVFCISSAAFCGSFASLIGLPTTI